MSGRGEEFHPPIGEMDAATDRRGSDGIERVPIRLDHHRGLRGNVK